MIQAISPHGKLKVAVVKGVVEVSYLSENHTINETFETMEEALDFVQMNESIEKELSEDALRQAAFLSEMIVYVG